MCGLALLCGLSGSAVAQRGTVAKGPDPAAVTNAEEEKSSLHNLEVARHYFKQKKAYYASYKRADEMIAGHPEFSRLDEALYIAAMSGLYLAEGKGKQRLPQPRPKMPARSSRPATESARPRPFCFGRRQRRGRLHPAARVAYCLPARHSILLSHWRTNKGVTAGSRFGGVRRGRDALR
jgi:hypothetical protein